METGEVGCGGGLGATGCMIGDPLVTFSRISTVKMEVKA